MEKSAVILKKLIKNDAYLRAWKVGLYASMAHEVITYPLIQRSIMLDKGVSFPRIEDRAKREMLFRYITNVADLNAGSFGILEPSQKATVMEHPDVIIMPLVAFDVCRNRFGQGGGYYDRYFSRHPECFKIALAYESQKTERIPTDEWDVRPDLIITEEAIYD